MLLFIFLLKKFINKIYYKIINNNKLKKIALT